MLGPLDTDVLHSRLDELIAEHKVPGAAVGVLHDGDVTEVAAGIIKAGTQGEASLNDGQPAPDGPR
jgi:hypothetical protein